MRAQSKKITEFMHGKDKRFMIPVYQRNYNWKKKEQCQTLWDDLEYIIKQGNNKPHFFGSIVSVRDKNTDDLIVIDGQQRLTTVSLLLLAIGNKAKEFNDVIQKNKDADNSYNIPPVDEIMGLCLDYKNKNKIKLKLIRGDMEAYQSLIDGSNTSKYDKNNIIINYNFFKSQLTPENIGDIYKAVQQLEIVDIGLGDNDDNPQLVFESLNSKGLDLSDADKIRNFILIGLDYEEQERLYSRYWEPIEENAGTSSNDTTTYIWNFLACKTNKKSALPDVYKSFKEYKRPTDKPEDILKELHDYSEIYFQIKTKQTDNKEINDKLTDLRDGIEFGAVIPLLLDVFMKYSHQKLGAQDVMEIMKVIESYFIRRKLCRLTTAGANKSILMNKKIDSILKSDCNASYADVFKFLIYSDSSPQRFPDDGEFIDALRRNDVYTSNQATCKYILLKIEQFYNPKENVDPIRLTLEHIMPQTLTNEWRHDLGENWENIHKTYLNTIGNLTLTGYNSEFSNRSFQQKKLMKNGFNDSALYLNHYMRDIDTWTEHEIIERGKKLSSDILKLWPVYKPMHSYANARDIETVALDNDSLKEIITNRKPQSFNFSLLDTDIEVKSWKDLYARVIETLYANDQYKIKMRKAFAHGNDGRFKDIVSKKEENIGQHGERFWEQLLYPYENIYFRVNKSADSLLGAIKIWFDYLGIDESDLSINLK